MTAQLRSRSATKGVGGAPFTKDAVYLSGFLAVSTFMRAAFVRNRVDCLGLLFAGKLDLFAIPALCELRALGLCRPAAHRPPWVMDPRWVLTWLTISTFAQAIDLGTVSSAVGRLLDRAPKWYSTSPPADRARQPGPRLHAARCRECGLGYFRSAPAT